MDEISPNRVRIDDDFWNPILNVNATASIFHQWDKLEASGCIDNFRIAAGEKNGFRVGWFFADSDATKWLDAASRILREDYSRKLAALVDDFIALLERAQTADGYLFTYNQIHFPGQRWVNLQVEHELYCHGHLIEAGVSHYQATGRKDLLQIARKAADLIVRDFMPTGPMDTPGHEEIEIALLRLYEVTKHEPYREMARHFLEQRGRTPFFGIKLAGQFASNGQREKAVAERRLAFQTTHPGEVLASIPAKNEAKRPPFSVLRFYLSGLSGKYFQQHRPIRGQTVPVGHSVRFGYLETAEAMLLRGEKDDALLRAMQTAWQRMVLRRMDVSGGLGALPDSEGFGRDYELDPEVAYNETCAAIASLNWNWQLACLTGEASYSDLFEWQLYNAVLVGVDRTGSNYLYNNPTLCRGGITRQPWYSIPCCPSNISRTFADLGKYIFTSDVQNIWVHQYIGSSTRLETASGVEAEIASELPQEGNVHITLKTDRPGSFTLRLRRPSWARSFQVNVNGELVDLPNIDEDTLCSTATGVDPFAAEFVTITREWQWENKLEIHMGMPICVHRPHPRVKALRGKAAVSRGPLLYCLESCDNPGVDIFNCRVNETSLNYVYRADLLGGTGTINGYTQDGKRILFIPYHLWGNRGQSTMTAWVKFK